ncbi:Alpha-N-acetylglucosaminidase like protein [Argiope bruennichi]|uniref:Alpha-N-acetylglucosaminidase like protein n=1 Tax=Argiope bruennichi TaxID=94029 RepID=A0A8T0FHL8_ARGBR|nr:Alpha-N-acetylglucosaminidase like protein [Argiope bruennichi]
MINAFTKYYSIFLQVVAIFLHITVVLTDVERRTYRSSNDEADAVTQLLHRLIPEKAEQILIEVDYNLDNRDAFEISTQNDKVLISGTRGYAAAAGVYHYLKEFCGCHISWSGNQLRLPVELPKPTQTLKIRFNDKYRYYQNVCTSSYSYVWWTWDRWEKEIDWMALNGINLPLAFTAQEAIYYKIFKEMNFTVHDIDVFVTGPAFLAWNRMGNMQAWVGPLTDNWHRIQFLPLRGTFPHANTTYMNRTWAHFQPPFAFVTFLQPTDPLFEEIGAKFLRAYIEEFGTDHMYSADLFNEMPPPSSDPDYLQSCSKSLYKSLTAVDPEAVWITQGWMFYSDPDIWQPDQARAFLRAVPQGKMIILDLQSELYPQYHRLPSYYGQPFIWCMLHNYGGVTGLYGSLEQVNTGPFEGRNYEGSTMIGTGLTPEGIETNDIVYELMNEMGWRKGPVDLHEWLEKFASRKRSVYNATDPYRNHGKYILIRRPSLKLSPYVWYDPKDVFIAWDLYVNASDDPILSQSLLYKHDLVDITRQGLQLTMDIMYPKVVQSFRKRNLTAFREISSSILELYDDLDELLASDEHFLLGRWINDALNLARTPLERRQYEYNARNQITLWGPSGELVDYANKQWAGLISNYYKKRWQFFFETLEDTIINRHPFKQADFNKAVFTEIEYKFDMGEEFYSSEPKGDPIEISKRLFEKYKQTQSAS